MLFNGFRPLFQALTPGGREQARVRDHPGPAGRGRHDGRAAVRTASLTNTLADRDAVIGGVITNLNTVLATVDARDSELDS